MDSLTGMDGSLRELDGSLRDGWIPAESGMIPLTRDWMDCCAKGMENIG